MPTLIPAVVAIGCTATGGNPAAFDFARSPQPPLVLPIRPAPDPASTP